MSDVAFRPDMKSTYSVMFVAALTAVEPSSWPTAAPVSYYADQPSPSYSRIGPALTFDVHVDDEHFFAKMAEAFETLAASQSRLGAEFERIWDDNVDALYES